MANETNALNPFQDGASVGGDRPSSAKDNRRPISPVESCLRSLASLKLTVGLFALSLLLVWFGTLAQDKQGIWEVVRDYFRSFFVWVQFDVFRPKGWFGTSESEMRYGFWFPGGKSIGLALFINLLAAHAISFKIHAKGMRLLAGLGVIGLGSLITLMVIVNGNMTSGIQDDPILGWHTVWLMMIGGVFVTWSVMISGLFRVPAERFLERILLILGFLIVTVMLGLMIYFEFQQTRLDDSSLRILWQLMQGLVAGGVTLVGCVLAFKRRAGIVLLHAGVGLMMLNELLVAEFAREERMTVVEGQSTILAHDTREVEISVIHRDDPRKDVVVAIPQDHIYNGAAISHDLLPFDLVVERFDVNSTLDEKESESPIASYLNHAEEPISVTSGIGLAFDSTPIAEYVGADANAKINLASTYVSIYQQGKAASVVAAGKSDEAVKPLETLLLSQQAYLSSDYEEEVEVDGTTYFLALRFKHRLKPYRIELEDVEEEKYVGTDIARGYASKFVIVDREDNSKRLDYRITMNNPLRYEGETFYQSGYFLDPRTGEESSTFQIVTNDGWMIPYVSCMLVVVGMLAHFGIALTRFLRREDADAPMMFGSVVAFIAAGNAGVRIWNEVVSQRKREAESVSHKESVGRVPDKPPRRRQASSSPDIMRAAHDSAGEDLANSITPAHELSDSDDSPTLSRGVIVTSIVVGIGLVLTLYYATKNPGAKSEFRFDRAGEIPVVSGGRVLPLESYARNTLRVNRRRETFVDRDDERQTAVKWMLDLMAGKEEALDYKVFRIDSPQLQALLGLKRLKSKDYSYNDIMRRGEEFDSRVEAVVSKLEDERTTYDKAVLDLKRKINEFETVRQLFELPSVIGEDLDDDAVMRRIDLARGLTEKSAGVVLAVTEQADSDSDSSTEQDPAAKTWETFHVGVTKLWLREFAREQEVATFTQLGAAFLDQLIGDRDVVIEQQVQNRLISEAMSLFQETNPDASDREIAARIDAIFDQMPPEIRRQAEQEFEREIRMQLTQLEFEFAGSFAALLADGGLEGQADPTVVHWRDMLAAYRDGDAEAFNEAVDSQLAYFETVEAEDLRNWRIGYESFYRRFSPLYVATILYVFAGVIAALAWGVWHKDLNKAAFWLLVLALAIHTFALVSRIAISGRPPVTNLYSSAVFIGWSVVLLALILELVFRIGIGNVLASVAGTKALLIANALSIQEDTFQVVQAVLDTQFWLATHVVCITLGYATTYLAGGLGASYIVSGLISSSLNAKMRKQITGMLYGMVCFSIFFSFFGTVLGGLWADDSWGRFWGWDPKENGALMIVIWNAMVLHARWGGLIRGRGMAVLAVGGNIITTWSWFLVNQLGIGLHAYGFNKGVLEFSAIFIMTQLAIIAVAMVPTEYWASYRASERAELGVVPTQVSKRRPRR